jgi:hypothetical protein
VISLHHRPYNPSRLLCASWWKKRVLQTGCSPRLWLSRISYWERMKQRYLINWLTLRSWALLERPLDVRSLDSFPAFHGTRSFSTEFTRALHLFLSLVRPIQSRSPHPTSSRSILILSTTCDILLHIHIKNANYLDGCSIDNLSFPWLNFVK